MARGTPDWSQVIGDSVNPLVRSDSNQTEIIISNLSSIGSGVTTTITISTPPSGEEDVYLRMMLSCEDDSAIHRVRLYTTDSGTIFSSAYFIQKTDLVINQKTIQNTNNLKLDIKNNSDLTVPFRLSFALLRRKII